ncbi:MAG: S24/S26 family peptidase [Methanobacteriaceae archaeon]|nr:MAG: phage repressor protein [Methanobacterium sp. BRmetb2]MCC7558628.1 S24/S26 family peptidase [Methanobacteriaceae archaeon]
MKSRSWIIAGIIVVFIVAAASAYLYQGLDKVDVTIDTNGTEITVKTTASIFNNAPPEMTTEIEQYVTNAVKDYHSTVESIQKDVQEIVKSYGYKEATVTINSQFGLNQLPMPAVVNGDSMVPTLKNGQQIVVLKTDNYKVGDIVVAVHPEYDLIVKRLSKIEGDRVYLTSDNKNVETTTIYHSTYYEVITKTPLNTWLPKDSVIGVVKVY